MAIYFNTTNPQLLLGEIKKAIKDGRIVTWLVDENGDFTHNTEQWKYQAWLRPKISSQQLIFSILRPKNKSISSVIYAIYHGRFIESVLTHFDGLFSTAMASALPAEEDNVT